MRITPKRKKILETLKQATEPISAQTLHSRLTNIDLVTVYRNLEAFSASNLVTVHNLNPKELLYEISDTPTHYGSCNTCGNRQRIDIQPELLSQILANNTHLCPTHTTITITSHCTTSCQKN